MRADPIATTIAALAASLAVIDGDTVHLEPERYRQLGIDAAEIHHAQCDAERRLRELTKHRLEALIRSGPVAFAPNPPSKRDKFGRLLVHLLVNGEDAACILIREGYARPWRGRREDWCTEISLDQPAVTERRPVPRPHPSDRCLR
jgi:micrococcal nuclease